jgi:hypothetical protein
MTTFLTTITLMSSHSLTGSHGFFKITHNCSLNMELFIGIESLQNIKQNNLIIRFVK